MYDCLKRENFNAKAIIILMKKFGIGFHGDGERKKVIGVSLCSSDVVREINWIWYNKSERIS